MQSHYAVAFVRDMGCTPDEWLRWLPDAIGVHPWRRLGDAAEVELGAGTLALSWSVQAPLQIALLRMPRLRVSFCFSGLDDAARYQFMKRFDLYMQRGGG